MYSPIFLACWLYGLASFSFHGLLQQPLLWKFRFFHSFRICYCQDLASVDFMVPSTFKVDITHEMGLVVKKELFRLKQHEMNVNTYYRLHYYSKEQALCFKEGKYNDQRANNDCE